ncbi:hypothetical protein [Fibrobacter sp.]|uniref:hypothetical protein n=1 Tax=Fibrobacter sp. TaxID=35828 RepID=UPI00386F78B7
MKRLFYVALFSTLILVACGDDDSGNPFVANEDSSSSFVLLSSSSSVAESSSSNHEEKKKNFLHPRLRLKIYSAVAVKVLSALQVSKMKSLHRL